MNHVIDNTFPTINMAWFSLLRHVDRLKIYVGEGVCTAPWSARDGFALLGSSVSGHAISGSSVSASDSLILRSTLLLLGH
jgi:hypothetical protein